MIDDDSLLENLVTQPCLTRLLIAFSTKVDCSEADELFLAIKGVGIWSSGNL